MRRWAQLLVLVLLLGGCAQPPSPAVGEAPTAPPRTPTPVPATDEAAVLQLLAAEGESIIELDIERLMEIWAEDGVIVDARHTPDDSSDDLTWRGEDAIRQRYVTLVFPGNPAVAGPMDAQVTVSGDTAEVSSTTQIGSEVAPGGDRWTFARRNGLWLITSLTYNLESK
ncbi:MAG TPA: hypothetical protein VM537_16720 [Anaerolineae bacterium]|nr:hypothetical protein [Anaerolineae bacterium]